ncbi:hypothetical protein B2J93_6900 [Marssonina coronariae]|uniref:Uncharacterized protein n=1 Tax=Diplocarpon coronariae TaxID=2795749 RepID=A0A218YXZ8_9HELO|nr:hypothetical protein B2J93_6900 [Marssonina coronariae]
MPSSTSTAVRRSHRPLAAGEEVEVDVDVPGEAIVERCSGLATGRWRCSALAGSAERGCRRDTTHPTDGRLESPAAIDRLGATTPGKPPLKCSFTGSLTLTSLELRAMLHRSTHNTSGAPCYAVLLRMSQEARPRRRCNLVCAIIHQIVPSV